MRLLLVIFVVLTLFQSNFGDTETTLNTDEIVVETSTTEEISATTTPSISSNSDTASDMGSETAIETASETASETGGETSGDMSSTGSSNDNAAATCSSCTAIDEDASLTTKISNPCEIGECVPYYLCLNGSIITSGEGILDVRIGADDDPQPERHPCPDFFDTCCILKSKEIIETAIKTPIGKPEKCGIRNKKGAGFNLIERDNEAQFAEFPWVVAIIHRVHDNDVVVNVYKCGGSLIHPSVIMTAAHCVVELRNVNEIMVRAGEWDTQTINEPYPHQDRNVMEVVIHEHYKPGSHFNDVALLFLDKPVELAENINTVCLPPQDFNFDHKRCYATGWGKDKFGKDGLYQVILKRIELPVVPSVECEMKLRETRLGRYFKLDPSFICAGGEHGRDTCQGDGGSPLSCDVPDNEYGQYYLAGEVAWGIGCFDPIPGVYVNVAKFRHWVDDIFEHKNLEKSFYTAY